MWIDRFLILILFRNQSSGSSDSESSSEEEKTAKKDQIKSKPEDSNEEEAFQETEAQKKQRELIEKQRLAQLAAFEQHKIQVQEEEAKRAEEMAANKEQRIDLTDLKAGGDLDIDDIWPTHILTIYK